LFFLEELGATIPMLEWFFAEIFVSAYKG